MNVAELLVQTAVSGQFLECRPGMSLTEINAAISLPFVDQKTGRATKMLRRDYGLVEFFFESPPDWTCSGATIQIHRLAHEEVVEATKLSLPDVDLQSRTPWLQVAQAERRAGRPVFKGPFQQQGARCFRSVLAPVDLLVLDEPNRDFDSIPRNGDIWSMSLYRLQWWRK